LELEDEPGYRREEKPLIDWVSCRYARHAEDDEEDEEREQIAKNDEREEMDLAPKQVLGEDDGVVKHELVAVVFGIEDEAEAVGERGMLAEPVDGVEDDVVIVEDGDADGVFQEDEIKRCDGKEGEGQDVGNLESMKPGTEVGHINFMILVSGSRC